MKEQLQRCSVVLAVCPFTLYTTDANVGESPVPDTEDASAVTVSEMSASAAQPDTIAGTAGAHP